MRSAWRRTVSIALLVLLVALFPWQLRVITVQPKREANPEHAGNKAENRSPPISAEDRIADYTEYLAAFTFLLAVVSSVQIWFLIRADKTARFTADAAKLSANVAERALEQTSAPYLDVTVTLKAVIHRFIGGGISAEFMTTDFAEYVVHNYGSSPAIILETYQYCIRSRTIPEEIPFPLPQSNLLKVIIVGGMKESQPIPIGFPSGGIPDASTDEGVWVGFQIRYRDLFINQYISAYCCAYNKVRATFSAYGGPKYNYRRKLTDEERKTAEARDS